MQLLKPKNPDFFDVNNGNLAIVATGIQELLKLHMYPVVIQFDCEEDVIFFAEQVLKYSEGKS